MGSTHNHGTDYCSSQPKPCANNCGFFGTAENRNLCSKCYKDLCIREQSASAAVKKPLLHPSAAVSSLSPEILNSNVSVVESSSYGTVAPSKPAKNRCGCCNKKVGLTGFVCKCGTTFCGVHRYPEKHDCSYDFKGAGRDAICKANPVVKAEKIERLL